MNRVSCCVLVVVTILRGTVAAGGEDRQAQLPQRLDLCWVRQLPPRKPAWVHTPRMLRDTAYEPVACGRVVLVGCCHNDALLAVDQETGEERWRFYTNGPIRFAPVVGNGRAYVGSDDGYLYCLNADRGELLWKFRGGPSDRKVIGHERVISAWPVSARPALADGKVFVVAGHWPLEGIFLSALDARTGQAVWTDDTVQFRPHGAMRVVGDRLHVYGHGGSGAFEVNTGVRFAEKLPPLEPPRELPEPPGVEGEIAGKFLGGGRLFASTREGRLYCFGPSESEPKVIAPKRAPGDGPNADLPQISGGYVLVLGLKDGRTVEALLENADVQVVAVDADAKLVDTLRRRFDARGLFDDYRLAVHVGDPETFGLPPYMASLIVSEKTLPASQAILRSLRPYGGVFASGRKTIRRDGPPEGAADWTHEFADEANTLCVHDTLLKPPLGIQWYEGPAADLSLFFDGETAHDSGDAVTPLPPGAVFVEGRMILQGPGVLAAFDIYTGRQFWRVPLPETFVFHGVGIHSQVKALEAWDYRPAMEMEVPATHRPRANGFNYVAARNAVYVAAGRRCLRFDAGSGRLLSEWKVPLAEEESLCWGNLRLSGNLLVATAFRPQDLIDAKAGVDGSGGEWAKDRMPMTYLMILDRQSGNLLWHRRATWGFLNRGMAVGGGRIYCVDLLCENVLKNFKQAGRKLPAAQPSILALDLRTGRVLWSMTTDVLVKNLTYSKERDILLAPARLMTVWQDGSWIEPEKKRGKDAVGKMRAIRGRDGKVLWEVAETLYYEPHVIHGDLVIDRYGWTYDLRTGQRHQRVSPLAGQEETWQIRKGGCNHLVASENLVTWRTAFYDLDCGGAMPLVGMEAGCTPSLLVSGGVLCNPNYGTRIKRARMTTLAMIHQPKGELWLRYDLTVPSSPVPIRRVGYNFGAPGDRFAEDGTVWLNVVGRDTAGVVVEPEEVGWFSSYSSRGKSWIASSGVVGASQIVIPTHLFKGKRPPEVEPARWTVRLHFAEPETARPGQRVFHVAIQGKDVLRRFDVAQEATQANSGIVRELKGVEAGATLRISLDQLAKLPTVLCGVEIQREP